MGISRPDIPFTCEDYKALSASTDDRHELIDGELYMVPAPSVPLFISNERVRMVTNAEVVGAPDLVVEILSPGTGERDRSQKKTLYARNGVREYWIVDIEDESIEVFVSGARGYERPVRHEAGDSLVSATVPGLKVTLGEVFAGQPTQS